MECVRKIIDPCKLRDVIRLPAGMKESKVEIIILPSDEPRDKTALSEKLEAIDKLNGLIADQSKKIKDEFDQIINQRRPLREAPNQLLI